MQREEGDVVETSLQGSDENASPVAGTESVGHSYESNLLETAILEETKPASEIDSPLAEDSPSPADESSGLEDTLGMDALEEASAFVPEQVHTTSPETEVLGDEDSHVPQIPISETLGDALEREEPRATPTILEQEESYGDEVTESSADAAVDNEKDETAEPEAVAQNQQPAEASRAVEHSHATASEVEFAPSASTYTGTPAVGEAPDDLASSPSPLVSPSKHTPQPIYCRMCGAVIASTADHLSDLAFPASGRVVGHMREAALPGVDASGDGGLVHEVSLAGTTIELALFSAAKHAPPSDVPHGTDAATFFPVSDTVFRSPRVSDS